MIYCLNPSCPHPPNPVGNVHCQYCGVPIALRNRFKALNLLGQGGFGKTYLAQDLDNRNKPCVIKRLTYEGADDYATEKARQLFEQEAERLDQLVHPQIPRLLAYFQEGSYLYLVQEVIEGQTLHAELQSQGLFTEAKIRAVLQGLLPVLSFVHGRSVIHRDIKPDNIMRRRNGELILIDFGVAKFLEESGFTQSTTTIGTPGYAAPEQIQGRVKPASDLFALGATCFQLMSQCFDTDRASTVGYGWVRKWKTYVPEPISDDLAAILTRMIEVDDRLRYTTAADVLNDLNAVGIGTRPSFAPKAAASQLPTVAVAPASPQALSGAQTSESQTSGTQTSSQGSSAKESNANPAPANTPSAVSGTPNPAAAQAVRPLGSVAGPPASNPPPQGSSQGSSQGSAPTALSTKNSAQTPSAPVPSTPASKGPAGPLKKVPVSLGFWLRYGFFSYAGHSLGFLAAAVVTLLYVVSTHHNVSNISSADLGAVLRLLGWMHWPVAGFFVGLAQWLVVRKWLPRAMWWLPATVAGFWAIAMAIAIGYADAFSGILVGMFVGLPQWAAMRQQAPRAGWWVLWSMIFTAALCQALSTGLFSVLAWMALVPLLDGLFLSWILRQQVSEGDRG